MIVGSVHATPFLTRYRFLLLGLGAAMMAAWLMSAPEVSARTKPANSAEEHAKTACEKSSTGSRRGAIWLSGSSSYYSLGVTVSATATSTTAYIRGSAYNCRQTRSDTLWAIKIASKNGTGANGISAKRLSSYKTTLDRGKNDGKKGTWSKQGKSVSAKLDVSGLSTNNLGRDDTKTYMIGLYRCPSQNGKDGIPGINCGTEQIPIVVTRKARPHWVLSPSTAVSATSVNPGTRVNWTHTIARSGSAMDRNVSATTARTGWTGSVSYTIPKGSGSPSYTLTESYTPTNADAGKTFCSKVTVAQATSARAGAVASAQRCVTVNSVWSATPKTTLKDAATSGRALIGDKVQFNNAILNSGPSTATNITWATMAFIMPAGSDIDMAGGAKYASNVSDIDNCRAHYPGNTNCWEWAPAGRAATVPVNTSTGTVVKSADFDTSTIAINPGDRLCVFLVIQPWTVLSTATPRYAGNPACVTFSKTPSMEINGADSWSGGVLGGGDNCVAEGAYRGGFSGSGTSATSGSWSQYGLWSLGSIEDFGSAGATTLSPQRDNLKFANSATIKGNFYQTSPPTHCLSDPYSYYAASSEKKALGTATITGNLANGVYTSTSSVTIDHLRVRAGQSIVLLVDGQVAINGNITFPGSYTKLEDIPQLTIIARRVHNTTDAGDIRIAATVDRIDGTFAAYNNFVTCANAGSSVRSGDALTTDGACKKQLRVNGSVLAQQLVSQRTYGGASTTIFQPAEVYSYRPDQFLAPYAQADNHSITITSEQELAPRY